MTLRRSAVAMSLVAVVRGWPHARTCPANPLPDPRFHARIRCSTRSCCYNQNCSGCHGADGKNGPAMMLSDPVYLAIVDDDTLRSTISKGRPGTAMSAFAQKEGGMLTDEQITAIIRGIRERWSKPNALGGDVGAALRRQARRAMPHTVKRCTRAYCSSCHGAGWIGRPEGWLHRWTRRISA